MLDQHMTWDLCDSGVTGDARFCLVQFSTVSLVLIVFSICCSYGVLAWKHGT